LLQIWARTLPPDQDSLFTSARDMYSTLDAIDLAEIRWQSFSLSFKAQDGDNVDARWKSKEYDVWYRDPREVLKAQLANRNFEKEMDFAPKIVIDKEKRTRRYQDFMSGEWAWEQAVCIGMNLTGVELIHRVGYSFARSRNAWFDHLPHYPRERQDDCIRCYGSKRILPIIHVKRPNS
jgi:hypothetical protein